jgi:hypothetical protein
MLVSLMTIVNLLGFTCFATNLKFPSIFLSSKNLLNECSIARLLLFNPTGVGSMRSLIRFFCSIVISHLVSCPHTYQQNGVAECKHRHIVEIGLELLAHVSMPLKYWDESFLAATYLINRTPSELISYDTPLHKLIGATPDYSHFGVFRCVCWPNLQPYNSHKPQLHSTRCPFLGYSNMHRLKVSRYIQESHLYLSRCHLR